MNSRIEINKEKQLKIDKEQQNNKIKKIIKRIVITIVIIFFIVFFACFYVIEIATNSIIVNEKAIVNEKISESLTGLKVIQFSDLHYNNYDLLKDVVSLINKRNPDLVLFTGDLLKEDYSLNTKKREKLVKELKKITASLGKYAVLGEDDNEEAVSILVDCGFTILDNSNEFIYKDSNIPIMLVGINTNNKLLKIDTSFTNYDKNIYTILLMHKPDYIDDIINLYPIDLALAGHSHLGEIRIPYVFNAASKDKAVKYINSYYELNNTKFYISSGIGTSSYDVRINARPSINFFRLRKIN